MRRKRAKQPMGIKRRVLLGCIVLCLILFASSLISFFEFGSMNNYVTDVVADNIRSINYSRELLTAAESHNLRLMYEIDGSYEDLGNVSDTELIEAFSDVRSSFQTKAENAAADSVVFAYAAYMQVAREAQNVWLSDPVVRRDWFFNRLQPVYSRLCDYIQKLTFTCQDTLIANSQSMQENFQRSIMPPLVSLLLGLLLVLLFYYYLNYYLINPLLKVTKGIQGYRRYNKPYNVTLDTLDEIAELNETVKDIIDVNDSYKTQLKQAQSKK